MKCKKCGAEMRNVKENHCKDASGNQMYLDYAVCDKCGNKVQMSKNAYKEGDFPIPNVNQVDSQKKKIPAWAKVLIGIGCFFGFFFVLGIVIGMVQGVHDIATGNTEPEKPKTVAESTKNPKPTKESEVTEEPTGTPEVTETPEPTIEPNIKFDFSKAKKSDVGEIDTKGLELPMGELLSVIQNGKTVVIKAKIEKSYSNNSTIFMNYSNVEHLITENGFDTCNEIQYWAVAEMVDGSDGKVISFTVPKKVIRAVKEQRIAASQIGDYSEDLWILPSLLE